MGTQKCDFIFHSVFPTDTFRWYSWEQRKNGYWQITSKPSWAWFLPTILPMTEWMEFHTQTIQGKFLSFSTHPALPFPLPFNPPRTVFLCIQTHFCSEEQRGEQLVKDRLLFLFKLLGTTNSNRRIWAKSNPLLLCLLSKLRPLSVLIEHKISCLILSRRIGFSFASQWILDFFPKEAKL